MKRFFVLYLLLAAWTVVLCSSCGKDDYRDFTKGGEIVYSSRLDTVIVSPGKNRLELLVVKKADPLMELVRIIWNSGLDSMDVPMSEFESDSAHVVIDGLEEGSYNFKAYTYDVNSNGSVSFPAYGEVYGDAYGEALTSRSIKSTEVSEDPAGLRVYFGHAQVGEIASQFRYLSTTGDSVNVFVPVDTNSIVLSDYKSNTSYLYRSLFQPEANFIDTFFTAYSGASFPLAENQLDKSGFSILELPTDKRDAHNWKMAYLWDGNYGTPGMATADGTDQWITIDLGMEAQLTRMKMWQAPDRLYAKENVKRFEVYGSNDPNPDGSWDSWTLILEGESFKPSNLPVGQNSEQDIAYAKGGESFNFFEDIGSYRYLRIKMLENWGHTAFMTISELEFWEKE